MAKIKTILIVEDDRFLAQAYKQAFEKLHCNTVILYDGSEVIQKAEELQPVLILLDILLPIKDGFTILAELKANIKTKKIPVIIASNLGQDSEVDKGKKLGAESYIIKSERSLASITEMVTSFLK